MLRVKEHGLARLTEEPHRIGNHVEIFLQGGVQHLPHMKIPGFSENGDVLTTDIGQHVQPGVGVCLRPHAARGAKGHQFCVFQRLGAHSLIEFCILGIAGGVACLDEVHSHLVQALNHLLLVLKREGYRLPLRAVAQRRIV